MKVMRAIPLAATLGFGAALFASPAHAVPWGQADYWGLAPHSTNCDCAAPTATPQQASQESATTVAKQTNPPGPLNDNTLRRQPQQR